MPPVVELRLVPTPGAKPEFLCAVEPIPKEGTTSPPKMWQSIVRNEQRTKVIVLEGYTREPWAMDVSNGAAATKWSSFQVRSVDGRNKLPGFVNYLRERKKTCFGRFLLDGNGSDGDNGNDSGSGSGSGNDVFVDNHGNPATFVWIISHKQTSSSRLSCRVAPIHSIPNCNLRPKSTPPAAAAAAPSAVPPGRNRTEANKSIAGGSPKPSKRKGFGLLGNLVGAQRRTNHQVVKASTKASGAKARPSAAEPQAQAGTDADPSAEHPSAGGDVSDAGADANDAPPLLGSGEVLRDFRHEMEQKMLDFDISGEVSTKVFVRLADHTKKVREEDKGRITMEILKYIVYEQAEEVNEEWIAHKEPGEFTDEITVAIYKDAESAPPEVIEEMNQAEIPEEMKAQQKMIEQKRRQEETNARRIREALQRQALRKMAESSGGGGGGGLSILNTEKRDLRTIEEIQQDSAKRRKME